MQKSRQSILKYLNDNKVSIDEALVMLKNPEVQKEILKYVPMNFYEKIVTGVETLKQETVYEVKDTSNFGTSDSSISKVKLLPLNK